MTTLKKLQYNQLYKAKKALEEQNEELLLKLKEQAHALIEQQDRINELEHQLEELVEDNQLLVKLCKCKHKPMIVIEVK